MSRPPCRSWSGSTARTPSRAGRSSPRPAHPRIVPAATMLEAAERAASTRERGGGVSVLVGADTRLVVQGITGKEGTFHTLRNRAYGTNVVAGVTPGKGGHDVDGIPVFDTVADAVARDRREHVDDLRAAEVRGGGDPRGGRCGRRARRVHHRRHPGEGHGAGPRVPAGPRHDRSSGRTARASSRRGCRTSASSRARCACRGGSAS